MLNLAAAAIAVALLVEAIRNERPPVWIALLGTVALINVAWAIGYLPL